MTQLHLTLEPTKSVISGVYDPLVNTGKINEISILRGEEHDVDAIDKGEVNTGCSRHVCA